jgi:integrase/recombinase XerD
VPSRKISAPTARAPGNPNHPSKPNKRLRVSVPAAQLAHNALTHYQAAFHEWSGVVGYSPRTIAAQKHALGRFIAWADERGLNRPQDITRPILERYQRHLYHYRKHNGEPLAISAQLGQLLPLQAWFKWLTKQNHILYNPAADLDLPSRPKALPKGLLTIAQVEELLNACDTATLEGLRLRAMFEVFYSTGIRRFELAGLKCFDVDTVRGCLMVRLGKGARDRLVPLGERACGWVRKYLDDVREQLATPPDDGTLFLDDDGRAYEPGRLGDQVKRAMGKAGIHEHGACHLFRVACATHMLENGADIRYIQSLLGHAKLDTTQIYTQVTLAKLKEVHNATHPAKLYRTAPENVAQNAHTETAAGTQNAPDEAQPIPDDYDATEVFLARLRGELDA